MKNSYIHQITYHYSLISSDKAKESSDQKLSLWKNVELFIFSPKGQLCRGKWTGDEIRISYKYEERNWNDRRWYWNNSNSKVDNK